MKSAIMLITLLFFSVAGAAVITRIPEAEAQAGPTLKIGKVYNLNQTGTTFLLNITIENVAELGGWTMDLKWDPNMTTISTGDPKGLGKRGRTGVVYYNIYEGDFMKDQSTTNFIVNTVNNTGGTITSLACLFALVGNSVSGNGLLATINFTLLNVGTSSINITRSTLIDRSGVGVEHSQENGLITDQPPPPPPPIWMNPLFQTAVALFFLVVVLPAVVIVRLRGKATLTEKDLKEIEGYEEEIKGEPLPNDSRESNRAST